MTTFFFWTVLAFSLLRWAVFGYVISKHGEEQPVRKYNGFLHFAINIFWILLAYTLYQHI